MGSVERVVGMIADYSFRGGEGWEYASGWRGGC